MSVMGSRKEVIEKLEKYLMKRKYKKIQVNNVAGEIRAERKKSFFRSADHLQLLLRENDDNSTIIELTLNPQQTKRTDSNTRRELKLRSKIFFYL